MPDPVNIAFAMNLKPEQAIEYFQSKGYAISFRWQDVWKQEHRKAFTVAGVMKMDVLQSIREEVDNALNEGLTFRQFRERLEPELKKQGWWGRTEVVNSETGEVRDIDVTPHRLRHIYRQNMKSSFEAGRYQRHLELAESRPWWMYSAVGDDATRPDHMERDGTVLPADHPWWDENYPPNDHGCRCEVRSLSDRALERRGLKVSDTPPPKVASEAFAFNPGKQEYQPDLKQYPNDVADQYRSEQDNYEEPDV